MDADAAVARSYQGEEGRSNPFLHLSMHLSLEEQLSIDQPAGVKAAFERLLLRQSRHDAMHAAIECLAEMIWRSQRDGVAPDAVTYLACLNQRR